ncbi:MAG: 4'-phosphopantetheinyl transferase superfamily protein [Bacteroidales bacterium]|nr:4'-phosphopantetheinyl transferase superfamily protein [Bacteroidales bacterium]
MLHLYLTTFPSYPQKIERKSLSEAFIQQILQSETGEVHPIRIERTAQGKPYLPDYPELFFNYSDSGDTAVVATDSRPVGVDIEKIRPRSFQGILERFFLPDEIKQVEASTEEERLIRFFRLWTAKESLLKQIGCGLGGEMRSYEVCQNRARCGENELSLQTFVLSRNGQITPYGNVPVSVGDTLLTLCSESGEDPRFYLLPSMNDSI